MATRPTGTVTFVFTDIEGSTALLKQLGERYGEVLSQHRRIIRETFGAGRRSVPRAEPRSTRRATPSSLRSRAPARR
jgi:hypothetical protein